MTATPTTSMDVRKKHALISVLLTKVFDAQRAENVVAPLATLLQNNKEPLSTSLYEWLQKYQDMDESAADGSEDAAKQQEILDCCIDTLRAWLADPRRPYFKPYAAPDEAEGESRKASMVPVLEVQRRISALMEWLNIKVLNKTGEAAVDSGALVQRLLEDPSCTSSVELAKSIMVYIVTVGALQAYVAVPETLSDAMRAQALEAVNKCEAALREWMTINNVVPPTAEQEAEIIARFSSEVKAARDARANVIRAAKAMRQCMRELRALAVYLDVEQESVDTWLASHSSDLAKEAAVALTAYKQCSEATRQVHANQQQHTPADEEKFVAACERFVELGTKFFNQEKMKVN